MQKVDKCPESPKTIEKLEYFIDHDLGNIQKVTKVTPNMHVKIYLAFV